MSVDPAWNIPITGIPHTYGGYYFTSLCPDHGRHCCAVILIGPRHNPGNKLEGFSTIGSFQNKRFVSAAGKFKFRVAGSHDDLSRCLTSNNITCAGGDFHTFEFPCIMHSVEPVWTFPRSAPVI